MIRHVSTLLTPEDQALYEELFGLPHWTARYKRDASAISIDCGVIDFISRVYNNVVDWNMGAHGMNKGMVDTYIYPGGESVKATA